MDTALLYTPPLVCHPNMPPTAPDEPRKQHATARINARSWWKSRCWC